jgi:hypothetical protein
MLAALLLQETYIEESSKVSKPNRESRIERILREDEEITELLTVMMLCMEE